MCPCQHADLVGLCWGACRNFLLTSKAEGDLKLTDFGLGKLRQPQETWQPQHGADLAQPSKESCVQQPWSFRACSRGVCTQYRALERLGGWRACRCVLQARGAIQGPGGVSLLCGTRGAWHTAAGRTCSGIASCSSGSAVLGSSHLHRLEQQRACMRLKPWGDAACLHVSRCCARTTATRQTCGPSASSCTSCSAACHPSGATQRTRSSGW